MNTGNIAYNATEDQSPTTYSPTVQAGFLTANGSYDTLKDQPGKQYAGITMQEIAKMAESPQALDKLQAAWIIPSYYREHDGRSHEAQRQRGSFGMLAVDVDDGSPSRDQVMGAIEAICGEVHMLCYSSSGATADNMKWRAIVPLKQPINGDDYSDYQQAFFTLLEREGITPDYVLSRPGQVIYLPNVPPERRDEDGQPFFYQWFKSVGKRFLTLDADHEIVVLAEEMRAEKRRVQAEIEAERAKRQIDRELARAENPDQINPIDEFNKRHTVEDMLMRYGYVRLGSSDQWRSRYQSTKSFATKNFGDHWVSMSGSDVAARVGNVKGNDKAAYCWGDAFTLYQHYEHDGDVIAAVRAYGGEINPKPTTVSVDDVWESMGLEDFTPVPDTDTDRTNPESVPVQITNEFVDEGDKGDTPSITASPVDMSQLLKIPPRRWSYGTKLVRGFISILAAPAGVGKSAWSATMALDLASGKATMHDAPRGAQKVWLVNLEDPRDETLRKIAAAMRHPDKGYPEECLQNLFVDSGRDQNFIVAEEPQQGVMVATPQYEQLVREIQARKIDVLVLDPFVRAHHVNENANKSIDYVMDLFAKIADKCDISILLVHHTRKGFVGGDADSVRGSSSMVGAARVAFTLSAMSSEEAAAFNIPQDDRRSFIRVDNAKANLSKSAGDAQWIQLVSVDLCNFSEEYPKGDSVQVAMPWSPPDAWDGIDDKKANEILTAIEEGYIDEEGHREPYGETKQSKGRWVGYLIIGCTMDGDKPTKSEEDAKKIIRKWLKDGYLEKEEYQTKNRKTASGLVVKSRPGKAHD